MQDAFVTRLIRDVMTKSTFADRDTVGTIAIEASKVNERVTVGDMAHEFMPQLVDDLNEAIASNPFDDRPFYITIHETKDLFLKNMIKRRVIKTEYRPYPEPNTSVFKTDPKTNETCFCWSLPHKSTFVEYLNNAANYTKQQIRDILAYNKEVMANFGFYKSGMTPENVPIYYPIPDFKDRPMDKKHVK